MEQKHLLAPTNPFADDEELSAPIEADCIVTKVVKIILIDDGKLLHVTLIKQGEILAQKLLLRIATFVVNILLSSLQDIVRLKKVYEMPLL